MKKIKPYQKEDEDGSVRQIQEDLLEADSEVSRKLRIFFDSIQEEAIPERFLSLLEKLDRAELTLAGKGGAYGQSQPPED
ncbi:NepR family anti-sigma factor [Daeguia caeni]|uniref:NepR family anti-sigma factor n=1 Tax=Daeguia caeni TaxID=439612 RepID=A0ABV9H7H7_9HYPH